MSGESESKETVSNEKLLSREPKWRPKRRVSLCRRRPHVGVFGGQLSDWDVEVCVGGLPNPESQMVMNLVDLDRVIESAIHLSWAQGRAAAAQELKPPHSPSQLAALRGEALASLEAHLLILLKEHKLVTLDSIAVADGVSRTVLKCFVE